MTRLSTTQIISRPTAHPPGGTAVTPEGDIATRHWRGDHTHVRTKRPSHPKTAEEFHPQPQDDVSNHTNT
jgi:hypothetical protein